MKNKNIKIMGAALAVAGSVLSGASAFADNPYGIEYTGGEPLGANNVQIDPTLVNSLTPLLDGENVRAYPLNPEDWREGYINDLGQCKKGYYYIYGNTPVVENSTMLTSDGASSSSNGIVFTNGRYTAIATINDIYYDSASSDTTPNGGPQSGSSSNGVTVSITADGNYIFGGFPAYTDSRCQQQDPDVNRLSSDINKKMFVNTTINFYKGDSTTPYKNDSLYFGITDIDAAQSFKILNPDNQLVPTNMFAKSAEDLQGPNGSSLRNMYVSGENYIYSEYNSSSNGAIDTDDISNIYTKLTSDTQDNGVNMIFGFARGAASGITYYTEKVIIKYDADANGEITGVTEENIEAGNLVNGSTVKAKNGFRLKHWVADVDVRLENGSTIKAGEPITPEQVKQIVADEDITLTAIFEAGEEEEESATEDEEEVIAVPDTGASTGEKNAVLIPVSFVGIILLTLFIRSLPRLTHKKIGFNK